MPLLNPLLIPLLAALLNLALIPDLVDYPKVGSGKLFGSIKIVNFSSDTQNLIKIHGFNTIKYVRLRKVEF